MDFATILEQGALAATTIGIVFMAVQLYLSRQNAVTSFEDEITSQYRAIVQQISVDALLGKELEDRQFENDLNELYNYIDLCNEQVFLRQEGRVRNSTWENWRDGIRLNLEQPAFLKAWTQIKSEAPDYFSELRKLEKSEFKKDPKHW